MNNFLLNQVLYALAYMLRAGVAPTDVAGRLELLADKFGELDD